MEAGLELGLGGKSALVTAASDGLGLACALRLAGAGCRLAIGARGAEKLEVAKSLIAARNGGAAHAIQADLARGEDVAALFQEAVERLGGLDILVVNSGHVSYGGVEALAEAAWYEAFELLLMSAVRLVRLALPHMRARGGGDIVFIASSSMKEPGPLLLSNVMRAGVNGLAKSLSHDAAADNIRINVVAPGYFDTGRVRRRIDALASEKQLGRDAATSEAVGTTPTGRIGTAEELADLVAFVVSRRVAYLTGATIVVDGGASRGIF
jgi:3-oxoacyl-[acyl-carrier protein] reductase